MTGPESRLASLARPTHAHFAVAMAALVAAIAIAVLLGWSLGLLVLTSGLPGLVQTKVNAAICLLCLAASLCLVTRAPRKRHPIAWALSILVVLIASATLIEHFSGISLGIDQLFVTDQAGATSPHPGRFAVQTGVAFCAAALACLSMGRSVRGIHPAEVLAVVCGIVGGVSLLGYLYGARELLSLGSATQISLPASVGLIALAAGLSAADPEHALVRQTADPGPAGQVIRRIVPAALIIVPAGAWLRLAGERAGLYDESIGLTILVSVEALLLIAVGVWTTSSVRRLVAQRQQVELDLIRLGAAVSTPLIETAPVGLAVLDRDLRYLYVNPALASIDGIEASVHLGQRLDRVSPGLGAEATRLLEGVLKSGEPVRDIEVSGRASAGEEPGTWLLSAEPLRDETEETAGLALSVIDITERKHREDAVAALAELRRQSQIISDSIPYGFWIADPDGHMRYLSPQFLELIGRSEEQALGGGWIEALVPEDAQATLRDWHAAVASGRAWNHEITVEGTDGRRHTILSRGFPVRSEDGQVTSWAGINLDISDRKDAEAFGEAFAGILSHELRTPITSIHAASALLSRAGLDDTQRVELLDDIAQESERLRRLVEDLVVLAKAERGSIQVHTEPVLLPHLLRRVCEHEQVRWPDRRIHVKIDGSLPVAQAETAFVEQVVRNLLGNAAKYGPIGGEIDLIADAPDGSPRVRVLDRGPGVDPAEADRLFELFYRSQRTSRIAGSGIGLFVAHRLISSMGGTIWARPREDGEGAEFGFQLQPLHEDA